MINNSVGRIIGVANRIKPERYKILTFPTHERYETQLCKTGHDFYSFSMNGAKKWNASQISVPSNYHILPEGSIFESLNYDFILVQSKFWQYQVAQQINQQLNIPIIVLEHTVPTPPTMSQETINGMRQMIGDINIFISNYSKNQWKISYNADVIHHGIDTETFAPRESHDKTHILTVANDFVNRDYCLNYAGWKRITHNLPVKLVGDTPGLSKSASNTDELVDEYNNCAVYFNSSTLSPIPTSLLEAMSCGCAVVSTATCMIPEVIINEENGFMSNNESELRKYIEALFINDELRQKLGRNARQTILNKFSQSAFIQKWNKIFDTAYEVSIK